MTDVWCLHLSSQPGVSAEPEGEEREGEEGGGKANRQGGGNEKGKRSSGRNREVTISECKGE